MWEIGCLASLTLKDVVDIRVSLEVLDNEKYQCKKCTTRYKKIGKFEYMQATMGCINPTDKPRHTIHEFSFNKCPGNFFSESIYDLIRMHSLYELGVMPFAGSPNDQPYKLIEAFDIITEWKSVKMKKALDESKQKTKAKGRGWQTKK